MTTPSALHEFKEFVLKGNAVSLAVGVLIGASFGKFVTAITEGIIAPLIKLVGGERDISLSFWIFDIGMVLNALIGLLITGAILFFVFIRPMNHLVKKEEVAPSVTPPPPTPEEILLTQIRDLLRERQP